MSEFALLIRSIAAIPYLVANILSNAVGKPPRCRCVRAFISILPALFYYIGYSLMRSSMYSRRDEGNNAGHAALTGLTSVTFYWILTLFTLYLSRLREIYADRHSATVVDEGARKLSEGLAKIAYSTENMKKRYSMNMGSLRSLRALFISDPDSAGKDARALSR